MEIISGDKEAEWVFRGVTSNPKLARSPVLILDVGGGSTEFIVGDNARAAISQQLQPGHGAVCWSNCSRPIRLVCGR